MWHQMVHLKDIVLGDNMTNIAAVAAIISPLWLPLLSDFSQVAALLLPILGVMWFVVQIWSRIFKGK